MADVGSSIAPEDFDQAIRDGEIRPIYMVLADLATDRVVAVEALARWNLPSGAVVPPDDFIPRAESTDTIIELDLAVAERALVDLARWQQTAPGVRVTVNLSGRHFARPDSVDRLADLALRAGVDPASVILELTETLRPDDVALAADIAGRLRALGFSLWLDDFGSGRSNLIDLIQLPLDGIKIDRPFAERLGHPVADAAIEATTRIAGTMGLTVTLEGIEERHQATRARELGCQLGQGFLWPHGLDQEGVTAQLA